ncbi:MAG TPA: polysaccharide biosynthesis/export family protein [Bacteroidia bacterium]|jgi:polysaccharide export outer membrane protein|nr:polysaccharide biosynthesis/export family protein [Bacteroidia bacterium]
MMLETDRNYQFTPLPTSDTSLEYKISANDFINFRLFSNDGFRLIDFSNVSDNGTSTLQYANSGIDYLVDVDGTVNLPVLGKTILTGLTIREAKDLLEKKYSQYYIKPYILLKVTNRRVIVFPGDPGTAKIIPLVNNNTTLIEAIALAGGITEDGKARKVKLIRGNPDKPQVYLIDLSTIYGIKAGGMVLQANDIIYITPQRRISEKLLERITPAISLFSSFLLILVFVQTYKLKL